MAQASKKKVTGFQDLEVYQTLFKLMTIVITKVLPKLPKEEKFDLVDQTRRACKAPSALLAEGFAKRYQKKGWGKYIDDCMGECYEMINHLSTIKAVYPAYCNPESCQKLIDTYDICCKQLTKLKQAWKDYHKNDD